MRFSSLLESEAIFFSLYIQSSTEKRKEKRKERKERGRESEGRGIKYQI